MSEEKNISPKEFTEIPIEFFYKKEGGKVMYYWRPLFENKEYSWYVKETPYKEIPYVELYKKSVSRVFPRLKGGK